MHIIDHYRIEGEEDDQDKHDAAVFFLLRFVIGENLRGFIIQGCLAEILPTAIFTNMTPIGIFE